MRLPGRPLRLLALLLTGAAQAAIVESIPAFDVPLAPTPVVLQLRLDLAAVSPGLAAPTLAPSALLQSVQAAPRLEPVAHAIPVDALQRVAVAREVLGKYEPDEFAKLPEAERDAALAALWDGWKARGLANDPAGPNDVDALVLRGVDDKSLTSASKSIFLGVAVLGYPLADALWLAHTRIRDAIEENTLSYPEGQRWKTDDHTPEFLGRGPGAQGLVDAWGAATTYAKQIIGQVRVGSRVLPRSAAATPSAAADFARLAEELRNKGDQEALDYLSGKDPTFTAFLLDVRKPGYYLYNGNGTVVTRIMETKAVAGMGLRRVAHPDSSLAGSAATYVYRPIRVLERLREVQAETGDADLASTRTLLAAYIPHLAALTGAGLGPKLATPFIFADPTTVPSSALDTLQNALASYPHAARSLSRYDLPLPAPMLRARLASGERHGTLDETRWAALADLFKASTALAKYDGEIRLVSETFQTHGKLVAPSKTSRGVLVQMFVLDELARLQGEPRTAFLRFAATAINGALAPSGT